MSEKKTKRKTTSKEHPIHKTSVKTVMKDGAGSQIASKTSRGGVRLTRASVKEASESVERFLANLGEECLKILKLKNKKTVTRDILIACLKMGNSCRFSRGVEVVETAVKSGRKGSAERPSKAVRQPIAINSCVKAFGKGIPLGVNAYRISEEAKYALSELSRAYVNSLGGASAKFANAGRRVTINASDVASAKSCV